ncbi:alpha/beta hydrolase [Pseudoalteromonas shioyasakiensis]|uniref:alpha/beta hydrolase n=1 Tax=Pseudoalteromonas shioyasakiensis TaxID=1190813 RepID=UPI0022B0DF66|nr:alpha/beta hydrolase-fold protein [Pseudoalteromonas shioyasakiensis]MCZ4251495.1 alpha/beta hydrolase-fold protein [Pseudoalteromonas shioyasakiensis]
MPYILLVFVISVLGVSDVSHAEPFTLPRTNTVLLKDKQTENEYPITIKLPRSYQKQNQKRYPVAYLLDANYSLPITSGASRFMMNSGAIEEVIIVAVGYQKGVSGLNSRIYDYTPFEDKNWQRKTGGASQYLNYLKHTVLPYIEADFRTTQKSTLVGNSLGGLFAAYTLFTEPSLFSNYIIGSPSVWFKENSILAMAVKPAANTTKVYIAVGELEESEGEKMVSGARQLAAKITKQSGALVTTNLFVIPQARHATAFPTTITQALDWIYQVNTNPQ